ncbi:hypothetical protein ZWY2020_055874 [Hordeum vulgare]|nr:hypothetical protein ZWY2020_055874 [Hordeum vulgare]
MREEYERRACAWFFKEQGMQHEVHELDQFLAQRRSSSPGESDLASYAAWDIYVPERAADGMLLPEDDYVLALGNPEGSMDKTCGKEISSSARAYTETEEADIGATIGADSASTN